MSEHDRFEELLAAAAAGRISPGELAELETHQNQCEFCRNLLRELPEIRALCLETPEGREPGASAFHSALRRKILRAYQASGASFSESVRREIAAKPAASWFGRSRTIPAWARLAAVLAFVAAGSIAGFELGAYRSATVPPPALPLARPAPIVIQSDAAALDAAREQLASAETDRDRLAQSAAAFESQRDQLFARVAADGQQLAALESASQHSAAQNVQLAASLDSARSALAQANSKLTDLQQAQASAQANFVQAERRVSQMQSELAEETASLDRERQLLQAGRDIRNIVSARNLHIIEVADVGYQGAGKPFGRIFYTEHQSLVFYAYDLKQPKFQQAFYVWGTKEGDPSSTQVLGMLFSDKKDRRCWSFRFDNPKVLSEINTVFVTLEPTERPGDHPKGRKVLQAYLSTPANYP